MVTECHASQESKPTETTERLKQNALILSFFFCSFFGNQRLNLDKTILVIGLIFLLSFLQNYILAQFYLQNL